MKQRAVHTSIALLFVTPFPGGRVGRGYNGTFTNNNPPLLPNKAGLSDDKEGLFLYNH